VRIHIGKGSEKIYAAHRVPNLIAGKSVADEHGLQAGFAVFAGRTQSKRDAGLGGIGILQPLTLADGIVGEHDEAIASKNRSDGRIARLAAGSVARTHEDCGAFAAGDLAIGNIEQRCDKKTGLALEDHLANAKAIRLHLADKLGIERRPQRHRADERKNLRAEPRLACLSLGARMNGGDRSSADGFVLRFEVVKILFELQAAEIGGIRSVVLQRGSGVLRRSGRLCDGLRAGESHVREGQREESGKGGSSHGYALILHQRGQVNQGQATSQELRTFRCG